MDLSHRLIGFPGLRVQPDRLQDGLPFLRHRWGIARAAAGRYLIFVYICHSILSVEVRDDLGG